jgi:DNA transformation protein
MVASAEFTEYLKEQLSPLGHIATRRMFGKTGVFCQGVMLGMVANNVLYLRFDEQNRVSFSEATALPLLNYAKGGHTIDLSFVRVPDRLLDEPEEFVAWGRSALAAARRVAAGRSRAEKAPKTRRRHK